ncbi:MAG: 50S ribosomal protein L17 [Bacteroidetes bacterium]|nr:50S ribosomal protein L17 [Bacteroidota bacterium]
MRHGDKINNLGRKSAHRQALLSNLACALIENKRIFTTLAKAKALRVYVEPIITKSKEDTTHSRRTAFSYLRSKTAVSALFKDVAVKVAERNGGYTRIIKTGNRQGDAAEMALIELVDFNELYSNSKTAATKKAKTTRRSRGTAKKATTKAEGTDAAETKGEDA